MAWPTLDACPTGYPQPLLESTTARVSLASRDKYCSRLSCFVPGTQETPTRISHCITKIDLGFNLGKPGLGNQQIMINCYLGAYRQQHSLYSCFIVYTEIIRCVGTRAKTGWLWMVCKAFGVAIPSLFKVSFYDTLYLHLGNL